MIFPSIFRPVRGMGAVVLGAGPAHALYFGTYEHTKELLATVTVNNNVSYGKPLILKMEKVFHGNRLTLRYA